MFSNLFNFQNKQKDAGGGNGGSGEPVKESSKPKLNLNFNKNKNKKQQQQVGKYVYEFVSLYKIAKICNLLLKSAKGHFCQLLSMLPGRCPIPGFGNAQAPPVLRTIGT